MGIQSLGEDPGRLISRMPYLSEQCPIKGDSEGAIYRPHGDIQIHQQPLLLLAVHRGSDPLEDKVF